MRVVVVIHYDDCSGGNPGATAVVKIPEGKTCDETFLAWIRIKHNNPNITMETIQDNVGDQFMYAWDEYDLVEIAVP